MNHEHGDRHSPEHASAASATRDHMHGQPAGRTHTGSSPHDKHAGHSTAAFRDKFWTSLLLTIPTLIWGHMLQDAVGVHGAGLRWFPLGSCHLWNLVFIYGGWVFVQGAMRELGDRPARDDDAHRAGDFRRVRVQRRCDARLSGHAAVGRTCDARHYHAARTLARDAVDRPGGGRAQAADKAFAQYGDPCRWRPAEGRAALGAAGRRCRARPPGPGHPGRRCDPCWDQRRQRVDDHRRVAAGGQEAGGIASSREP